jgi:hypothetical protein
VKNSERNNKTAAPKFIFIYFAHIRVSGRQEKNILNQQSEARIYPAPKKNSRLAQGHAGCSASFFHCFCDILSQSVQRKREKMKPKYCWLNLRLLINYYQR